MTLIRKPATFEKALADIAARLGWDGCADVLGKSESHLRKLGTPDTDRELSIRDAVRLDGAFRRAGGEGAPLLECYAFKLEIDLPAPAATSGTVLQFAQAIAKETGEAVASVIAFAGALDDPKAQQAALGEIQEAIADLQRAANHISTLSEKGRSAC